MFEFEFGFWVRRFGALVALGSGCCVWEFRNQVLTALVPDLGLCMVLRAKLGCR